MMWSEQVAYQKVFGWETPEQGGGNVWAFTTKSEHGNPTDPGAINGDFRPRSEVFDGPSSTLKYPCFDGVKPLYNMLNNRVYKFSSLKTFGFLLSLRNV